MIAVFLEIVKNISSICVILPPTVFIFTVTLLGDALEKSHDEEKSALEESRKHNESEILRIEEALHRAKENGDSAKLTSNLESLRKTQKETQNKLEKIKSKYNRINLFNVFVLPSISIILSLVFAHFAHSFINTKIDCWYIYILFVLSLTSISFGIYKIYLALLLVQEIIGNKKQNDVFGRLKEAIKNALAEDREGSMSAASIKFKDKAFPLTINTSTELELGFRVSLSKGALLNNVSVWFFIPDGFDLIDPPEKDSWRQLSDYHLPNIRTIMVKIGDLSVGQRSSASVKFRVPATVGIYKVKYVVYGDGYTSTGSYLEFNVV